MWEAERVLSLIDGAMNYYTLQLGRCAVFSVLLLAVIMALRGCCGKRVFLKGLLWSVLLLAPFIGRLKAFYEKGLLFRISWEWISICMSRLWLGRVYFAGMLVTAVSLLVRRRRISRFVGAMHREQLAGTSVFVCKYQLTPFTTGVLRPEIVVPRVMLEQYQEQELRTILLHEKMHIRLGHLLFYLLWDIWHVLLWVNPLFTVCLNYFKEDMEDICDSVTMRRGGSTGYEYGSLLLKSVRLLQDGTPAPAVELPFAFAGEEFRQLRQRVKTVAGYRGYRRGAVYGMVCLAALLVGFSLAGIRAKSYARY